MRNTAHKTENTRNKRYWFVFFRYDTGKDGFIDLMELKLMMEKLGAPQTHLGLKNMIKEVDEDFDGKLSFREVRDTFWTRRALLMQTNRIAATAHDFKSGKIEIRCSDLLSHPVLYFCNLDDFISIY